jgi:predicted ribosome quality control (RQC) complex YloA/Tae2 family protein
MSYDSLMLRSVVSELNETILGGEILSVIQSSPYEFVLRVSSNNRAYNLLFSVHPVYARVHLTDRIPDKDKRWHFADFLQTHIRKGTISNIEQVGFDRIIKLQITPLKDIIEPTPKILIGEFMGKHSNLILIDGETNKILESMKHIDENMSRFRQILPGETYYPPPVTQSVDFFSVDEEKLSQIIKPDDEPVWKKLLKNVQGMSPTLAKEIGSSDYSVEDNLSGEFLNPPNPLFQRGNDLLDKVGDSVSPSSKGDGSTSPFSKGGKGDLKLTPVQLIKNFKQIRDDVTNSRYSPNVLIDDQNEVFAVSAINLRQFSIDKSLKQMSFHTISQALEYYYEQLISKESFKAEKNTLIQSVKKRYSDLEEKQETLDEQMQIAEESDILRMKGDILIANISKLKRGEKEVTLPNPYDPNSLELTIKLDEKLSPSDNAQKYFQDYKKAKKSKEIVTKMSSKNKAELNYLIGVTERIEQADDKDTLDSIYVELSKRKIVKERTVNTKKSKEEAPLFRRYRSSEDFQIFVGRNDKENELLIKQESSPHDMWLHAKQIEGSHVLIRNPEKRPDIPRQTLLEAAVLAASFCKAKHSGIVPVDYTWVKYVRKVKGGKPGFVIYTNEKTLFVSPSNPH